ncbi:MAG: NADH-quinone oxidoreductase subunit L, partial [Bryobacteraceae bacterium]
NGMAAEQSAGIVTAICLLLLLGATGKSAQIPLYVWLPDAMAGPTPVSALIHAATMVTAGVYMVARSAPLFVHAPIALDTVAVIGLATAFFAATIGLLQNDIKKVYAYSTISQLGYMFLGLGARDFSAGIYHVMTHAFFKALLFLGAGSVIHALSGEQDLRHMGGLRKHTPITFWTLLAASLAISGVPPFSGFFSKDAILASAYHHAPWMYWVGVITAGMTAFYVFRAFFLAFFGEPRGHHHPHESPPLMTGPLIVLALLSIGGGFIRVPAWLEPMFPRAEATGDEWLMYVSVALGLCGIGLAYFFYVVKPSVADSLANSLGGIYKLVYNKYFVDELYDATVVQPVVNGSRTVLWRGFDAGLIDGAVNGAGGLSRGLGSLLKLLQGGNVRGYAAWVVFGSLIAVIALSLAGGLR